MKKLAFVLVFFCGQEALLSDCCMPCSHIIQAYYQSSKIELDEKYSHLELTLDELKETYIDYQEVLTKQRKLLEKLQILSRKNSLLEREILFLRQKDNEVVGLTVDSVATEKEIDR